MPPVTETARGGELRRTVALVSLVTVTGSLPAFLVGALAVFMKQDLHFDEARLGMAVALFYASSGLASVPGGRFAQRRGARYAIRAAAGLSGAAMLGMSFATSWLILVLLLVAAGVAHGVVHPAANLAVAVRIPSHRQGVVHGLKQSAVPVATLISGTTVPLLGLTIGWRYAFILAAAIPLLVFGIKIAGVESSAWGARVADQAGHRMRAGDVPPQTMFILAVATGFGAAAAISLNAFLVESGVASGLSPGAAGLLLAAGGVAGITTRIGVGWLADRGDGERSLAVVVGMLGGGSLGYLLLAIGEYSEVLIFVGAVLAFGAGWGWTGLFNFAVLRRNPNAPAAASGIIQAGAATGGIFGPLLFGAVAARASFPVAWTLASGLAGTASVLLAWAGFLMRPDRQARPGMARSTLDSRYERPS